MRVMTWMTLLPTLLALFGSAPLAEATPLERKLVPKEAAAVLHLDLDAIWQSRIYERIKSKAKENFDEDDFEEEFEEEFGEIGPLVLHALHSASAVTVWLDDSGESGAIAARGVGTGLLSRLLDLAPDHDARKIRGRTWHRFGPAGDRSYLAVAGRWVIFSDQRAAVKKTLAVLDGRAPRASKKQVGVQAPGSIFFLAVLAGDILNEVQEHASSALLDKGNFENARLIFGERGANLYARVAVEMGDASEARQVRSVVEGALALGSLASDSREVQELVSGIAVKQKGSRLSLRLELPAKEFLELMKNAR